MAHTSISPYLHPLCRSRDIQKPTMFQKARKKGTKNRSSVICRGKLVQEKRRPASSQSPQLLRYPLQLHLNVRLPDLPMQGRTMSHTQSYLARTRNVRKGEHVSRPSVPDARPIQTRALQLKPRASHCTSNVLHYTFPERGSTYLVVGKQCGRNASRENRNIPKNLV